MAKDVADEEKTVTPDDLRRVIDEINRQREFATEYNANASQVARGAIEQYGLERTAFGFARKLIGMEEGKRNAILVSLIDYTEKLGLLDPGLFPDDLTDRLQALVARAHNSVGAPRSDEEKAVTNALLVN